MMEKDLISTLKRDVLRFSKIIFYLISKRNGATLSEIFSKYSDGNEDNGESPSHLKRFLERWIKYGVISKNGDKYMINSNRIIWGYGRLFVSPKKDIEEKQLALLKSKNIIDIYLDFFMGFFINYNGKEIFLLLSNPY